MFYSHCGIRVLITEETVWPYGVAGGARRRKRERREEDRSARAEAWEWWGSAGSGPKIQASRAGNGVGFTPECGPGRLDVSAEVPGRRGRHAVARSLKQYIWRKELCTDPGKRSKGRETHHHGE
ncbi:hypothetical protein NDU88_005184 [Pleurodeles waltl]|uniref:Uncharacterized protein n=1 Tax=Pleurodeles waltl TaxID=8319 RepID=A0AAV7N532_PLEWA|nr:hypothetical protein NDU88_005184 [Pleurodeles waltl]